MRPLDKGSCPVDGSGTPISVNEYGQWRKYLIERIGAYCAYCGMPITQSLQVEHVIPKNPQIGHVAGSLLGWDNMLLACGACNNAKDNQPINFANYYFPEDSNPLLAFESIIDNNQHDAMIVQAKEDLLPTQKYRAQQTINLFKLYNIDRRDKVVDLRWKMRYEASVAARSAFELYQSAKLYNSDAHRLIVNWAKSTGFFDIWFDVFSGEPLVLGALINQVVGFATNCFDVNYQPIPRNPSNLVDPI